MGQTALSRVLGLEQGCRPWASVRAGPGGGESVMVTRHRDAAQVIARRIRQWPQGSWPLR